ncbi:type IV secretion system protein [Ancylobacter dichloromethanicus]
MGNTFNITSLLQSVDQLGQNYVSSAYQAIANAATSGGATGVAGLLLTLYVIFWGWASGRAQRPAGRRTMHSASFAPSSSTRWRPARGDFQTLVYNALNNGPSAIGNALLSVVTTANNTGTSANLTSVNGVQNALQNMWDTTNSATEAFLQNAGITNWGPYIFAAVFYVVMAVLIGFAIFLIVLSKMFMWLLLALAPVFIILLLFGVTSRFFSGWLGSIAQYFCGAGARLRLPRLLRLSDPAIDRYAQRRRKLQVCDLGDDRAGRATRDHRHPSAQPDQQCRGCDRRRRPGSRAADRRRAGHGHRLQARRCRQSRAPCLPKSLQPSVHVAA